MAFAQKRIREATNIENPKDSRWRSLGREFAKNIDNRWRSRNCIDIESGRENE